jgi:hypothetical protein
VLTVSSEQLAASTDRTHSRIRFGSGYAPVERRTSQLIKNLKCWTHRHSVSRRDPCRYSIKQHVKFLITHHSKLYREQVLFCTQYIVFLWSTYMKYPFLSLNSTLLLKYLVHKRRFICPYTGLERPLGVLEFEAPRISTKWHMKLARWSAIRTGCLHPQRDIPGTHLC